MFKYQIALVLILLAALILRLLYGLGQDHRVVYENREGDSAWYLANGYELFTGRASNSGIPVNLAYLPTPPVYLLFIGFWQAFLPPEAAVIAIRIAQAVLGMLTCYVAYRVTWRVADDERAGLVCAGVIAVSPAFITESAQIATETLYIFLVAAGMWVYVNVPTHSPSYFQANEIPTPNPSPLRWGGEKGRGKYLMLSGILFGLATLTRAILLAFPLGLAAHLVLVDGWRTGLKRGLVFLVTYALVVSTWTFYNLIRYDRLVIGAEGFAAFLYISAEGWEGPQAVDESLAADTPGVAVDDIANDQRQDVYVEAASQSIRSDPLGYLRRRGLELASGLAQPHGTAFFPGESLKDAASNWLRDDRTPGGLVALMSAEAFWPKLTLYVLHFVGLIMGLVGMWLTRRRWRVTLPLIGFIGYTLLVALVTLALPRYLFPMELFWWVFASVVISRQWSVIRSAGRSKHPANLEKPAQAG